ncbi:hypothetical protein M407DRAFT_34235 [Tulasnella calospora MUT 4182]|uniref:Uncharacterized protein n=1 Tax=Tulasnella calospora MUT 4182 TaxID=1051891 RepID=A0A0C3PNV6_9AGAM|nr:hypothetical protein M407DRAFT_34235 [Tulasnella calospora MUT 4182]
MVDLDPSVTACLGTEAAGHSLIILTGAPRSNLRDAGNASNSPRPTKPQGRRYSGHRQYGILGASSARRAPSGIRVDANG